MQAEFEIRVNGVPVAGASGPRQTALNEALRYHKQYLDDASEGESVELVEIIVLHSTGE